MFKRLLIADRGEDCDPRRTHRRGPRYSDDMIYSQDDAASLHARAGDEALLEQSGALSAYLDGPQILRLALEAGLRSRPPRLQFSERIPRRAAL